MNNQDKVQKGKLTQLKGTKQRLRCGIKKGSKITALIFITINNLLLEQLN
jgi:hypothetical protein